MNIFGLQPDTFSRANETGSVLQAGAWSKQESGADRLAVPASFLYLKDHQTQWVWMCSLPRDSLREAARAQSAYDPGAAAYSIAWIVHRVLQGKADEDWQKRMAMVIIAYLIKTRYAASCREERTTHFLVMNYGHANRVNLVALNALDQQAIPAPVVLSHFESMLTSDRRRFPHLLD